MKTPQGKLSEVPNAAMAALKFKREAGNPDRLLC